VAKALDLANYATGTGECGILFTCSAFGLCIDRVKQAHPDIAVLKPDEAMIEERSSLPSSLSWPCRPLWDSRSVNVRTPCIDARNNETKP
jgi:hypothetical protein